MLVEARLGLHQQTLLWSAGYVAFAVLALLAGVLALRRDAGKRVLQQVAAPPEPISNLRRARWVALAAVPSTWMLAVTSHLTTTVLPMPLLWVIPLAIYLLSFAIVFSPRPILKPRWMARALPADGVIGIGSMLSGRSTEKDRIEAVAVTSRTSPSADRRR